MARREIVHPGPQISMYQNELNETKNIFKQVVIQIHLSIFSYFCSKYSNKNVKLKWKKYDTHPCRIESNRIE